MMKTSRSGIRCAHLSGDEDECDVFQETFGEEPVQSYCVYEMYAGLSRSRVHL